MRAPLVLVADNDRAVSSLLCEVLTRAGLRVAAVYDGEAAAARLRLGGVDAFVCDLDMPGRTGVEVLEGVDGDGPPPATVVVSGYLDRAIEARLAALPFVRAVMRKPFDLFAFADVVVGLAGGGAAGGAAAAGA